MTNENEGTGALRPRHLRAVAALAGLACAAAASAQQQDSTGLTLPTVQVNASQYDADDVRPEGVTTATKTYMAPRDIP